MIHIAKGDTPTQVKTISMLIYGQSGVGKTSLAFTAKDPVLVDFDNGLHRIANKGNNISATSWEDAMDLVKSHDILAPYQTVCIDTVGTMLDVMAEYLIRENPKVARKDGNLTRQGYGSLKVMYTIFLKKLARMGKDVILLCHDREDRDGDSMIVRPDITDSVLRFCRRSVDLMGAFKMEGNDRILDFNPSESHIGKNCAKIPPLIIPDDEDFASYYNYLEKLIVKTKFHLNNKNSVKRENVEIFRSINNAINKAKPADLDLLKDQIDEITNKPLLNSLKSAMMGKIKELNVLYYVHLSRFRPETPDLNEKEKEYLDGSKETGTKAVKRTKKAAGITEK